MSARFATTRWSVVLTAGRETPGGRESLARLCQSYWFPLYAYVRRRGYSPEDAQDLTQAFFARLMEKNWIEAADRTKGRFRSFLLTAMKHFLADEWDRERAQKRGGGQILPLEFATAETQYSREPADTDTPERIFERRWALTLLERTLAALREQYAAAGKLPLFEALKPFLTGDADPPRLRTIAGELGMTEGAVKVAIHRLRQKYRELLRGEIAQTVAGQGDVDGELAELQTALRGC